MLPPRARAREPCHPHSHRADPLRRYTRAGDLAMGALRITSSAAQSGVSQEAESTRAGAGSKRRTFFEEVSSASPTRAMMSALEPLPLQPRRAGLRAG